MANTNKTKAEILQELESIKGLLLEEDDIPILQAIDETLHADIFHQTQHQPNHQFTHQTTNQTTNQTASQTTATEVSQDNTNPSVLPGQTSLFEDESAEHSNQPAIEKRQGFAAHLSNSGATLHPQTQAGSARPLAKASGENPFLPQHIRERLHGNNPPPLFEYETAKKIVNATKNIANKINKPRQTLVDDVVSSLMPQIEAELRHRLFAMNVEDLEKLLNEDKE